jgi:hypothetical protein
MILGRRGTPKPAVASLGVQVVRTCQNSVFSRQESASALTCFSRQENASALTCSDQRKATVQSSA